MIDKKDPSKVLTASAMVLKMFLEKNKNKQNVTKKEHLNSFIIQGSDQKIDSCEESKGIQEEPRGVPGSVGSEEAGCVIAPPLNEEFVEGPTPAIYEAGATESQETERVTESAGFVLGEEIAVNEFDFDLNNFSFEEESVYYEPVNSQKILRRHDTEKKDDLHWDFLPTVSESAESLLPQIEKDFELLKGHVYECVPRLHRNIHTLKGDLSLLGSVRTKKAIHDAETEMEIMDKLLKTPSSVKREASLSEAVSSVVVAYEKARKLVDAVLKGEEYYSKFILNRDEVKQEKLIEKTFEEDVVVRKEVSVSSVKVSTHLIDSLISKMSQVSLSKTGMASHSVTQHSLIKSMDDNIQRLFRMLRELEIHAESQIQSKRTELEESGIEFDPLEMDQMTRFQELSRLMAEAVNDIVDVQRDMNKVVSEADNTLINQHSSIEIVQNGLFATRLNQVDTITDRLRRVVASSASEVGKKVSVEIVGERIELDRVLLDKLKGPMEHVLRNSVAHGIEKPEERKEKGKPTQGKIQIVFKQEAGRVIIKIKDDGAGINVKKVREKAIQTGLWDSAKQMTEKDAVDMICRPQFSTADEVTTLAGRGVGMDAVRADVMALGGRFEVETITGRGMNVEFLMPTSIASAFVLIVGVGEERIALPSEMIEELHVLRGEEMFFVREKKAWKFKNEYISYVELSEMMGLESEKHCVSRRIVVVREGNRRLALGVDFLGQVIDAPLRTVGRWWSGVPGIIGAILMPEGYPAFLVDPLRMPHSINKESVLIEENNINQGNTVLVVDDSLTMRKFTARFLTKLGYQVVQAKDGREALDILAVLSPSIVLLDVEMPRMDGFECAKNIRQSEKHSNLPIVMITSRTGEKHRKKAKEIGVNGYLGKPFSEEGLKNLLGLFSPLNK